MRDGAPGEVLAGAPLWSTSVSSWLGSDVLAEDVPLVDGSLSVDVTRQVPESVRLVVPERVDSFSWVPGDDPFHPLAKFGQYLDISVTVTSPVSGGEWETRQGRFQIQNWDHDDLAGTVSVECVGLLQREADDRFTTPQGPRSNDTLASLVRRLAGPGVPVVVDGALVDRSAPQSFQWDEDRIGALYEIADAWPARLRMDEYGQLLVLPPLDGVPDPVLTFTDGQGGTVVSAPTSDTRDGVYNVVVARSSATDDPARPPVQGEALVPSGPFSVFGPYGRVVRFWSSPLATSKASLDAAARSLLANSLRPARQRVITCAPDPRIQIDDPVAVVTGAQTQVVKSAPPINGGTPSTTGTTTIDGGGPGDPGTYLLGGTPSSTYGSTTTTTFDSRELGWVVGYDLPLVAGAMTVRVGVSQ